MRRQSVPAFFMRRGGESDTDFYNGSRRTFLKEVMTDKTLRRYRESARMGTSYS